MTLLIKNVRLLGSAKDNKELKDVFVIRDTISAIGNFGDKKADTVLDGKGAYLSPGFIDVHSTSDHYLTLFDHPKQEHFLKQGVTTIIGGHCGASLAPLLYGSLESMRKWTNPDRVNINWHTVKELFAALQKRKLGVNFGTFVGHSTIRRALLGDDLRDMTKNEIALFISILERAVDEGAFGLSLGLGSIHTRDTSYEELKTFARLIQKRERIMGVHTRKNGGDLENEIAELLRLKKDTGVTIFINHLLPLLGNESSYEKALDMISESEPNLYFGIHPFLTSTFPLYRLLPLWAQTGGLEIMYEQVQNDSLRKKIEADIEQIDPSRSFVVEAPWNTLFIGRSLASLMEMFELSDVQSTLLELMRSTRLRAMISCENINDSLRIKALQHKMSLVTSTAHGVEVKQKQAAFPAFLDIREECGFSLEDAIYKITKLPAEIFQMERRGIIQEGNIADLVLFTAHPTVEIHATIVSGKIAVEHGVTMAAQNGVVITPKNNE